MVSDHTPSVLVFPQSLVKKKRSFKFANYIADKDEFFPLVEKIWAEEVHVIHMFKVVKKLRSLKWHLKKMNWEMVVCLRE